MSVRPIELPTDPLFLRHVHPHGDGDGHGHGHDHGHAQAQPAGRSTDRGIDPVPVAAGRLSPLWWSVRRRVAVALVFVAGLWAVIGWALA